MIYSIIIPVYNVGDLLNECVESIRCQTYLDYEIILIDDGSTDNSGKICDEWAEKDNRIRVIHKENGGLSDARNVGIRAAQGDYILFLDSDDYWNSNDVLKKIEDRIEFSHPDVLVTNYCKDIDGAISEPYYSIGKNAPKKNSIQFVIDNELWRATACNKVVKTSVIKDNELYFVKGINAEDMDWCARLAAKADSIDYLDVVLFNYRFRSSSISHTTSSDGVFQLSKNLYHVKDVLDKAVESKKPLLEAYLGYLVGVLLFNIAQVSDKTERNQLIIEAKPLLPYLNKSKSNKIQLINKIQKIFGLNLTLKLLGLKK